MERNMRVVCSELSEGTVESVDGRSSSNMRVVCSELSDGTVESVDGSASNMRVSSSQLVVAVTIVADSGVYVCNATNNVGFDLSEAHLSVLCKNTLAIATGFDDQCWEVQHEL